MSYEDNYIGADFAGFYDPETYEGFKPGIYLCEIVEVKDDVEHQLLRIFVDTFDWEKMHRTCLLGGDYNGCEKKLSYAEENSKEFLDAIRKINVVNSWEICPNFEYVNLVGTLVYVRFVNRYFPEFVFLDDFVYPPEGEDKQVYTCFERNDE